MILGNFRQKRVIRYIVRADGVVSLANVTGNIVVIIHENFKVLVCSNYHVFFPVCCSVIALCVDTQIIQHIETVYPDCALFHHFIKNQPL